MTLSCAPGGMVVLWQGPFALQDGAKSLIASELWRRRGASCSSVSGWSTPASPWVSVVASPGQMIAAMIDYSFTRAGSLVLRAGLREQPSV
jgi:hypothetical protein